jgi:three-Cys-motif partner protein
LIGELQHYAGREQAYVKHFLLSEYLETFAHKIASTFDEITYVDGFSGPWQSAGERYEDTSFGIALGALTRAKATWKDLGRSVKMSAHLIEKDRTAYKNLQDVKAHFPEIQI